MSARASWLRVCFSVAALMAAAPGVLAQEAAPQTVEGVPVPAIDDAFTPDLSLTAEAPAATPAPEATASAEPRHRLPAGLVEKRDAPADESTVAATPAPEAPAAAAPDAAIATTPAVTPPSTTEATAPVAKEAAPAVAETPAADPLAAAVQTTLAALLPKLGLDAREQEALSSFYAARANAPLFATPTGFTPQAQAAIAQLKSADEDGLEPASVQPPALNSADPAAKAESELRLVAAIMTYARLASGGRLVPNRVHPLITPEQQRIAPHQVLADIAGASDMRAAMAAFNPPQEGYRSLKLKLAEIRANGGRPSLEADLVANMERWRWEPRDMGETYVFVNIPDYEATIVSKGVTVHKTRVIVGRPKNPTPVFSDTMQYAVINPSWSVPYSIIKKEMLPKAQARGAAAFAGMEVLVRGKVVDPSQIDWSKTSAISVRQPPSERNALGRIKFLFPNRHAVYLHDTPNRSLFANAKRAYSHGCVRVHQPEAFGEALFKLSNPGDNWTEGRFRSYYGKAEMRVDLKRKIPVHIAYFTLSVDDHGNLIEREDIYGYNQDTKLALAGQTKTAHNGLISP